MVKSFSRSDKLKRPINSGVCNGSTDCKDDPVMNTGGIIFTPHASVPDPYAQGMRNVPDTYAQHVLKGLRSVHGLVLDANA